MITKEYIANHNQENIDLYTLTNRHGMKMKVMNYGGVIKELHVKDKNGNFDDVVLGFKHFDEYLQPHPFFGALVGRVAGRISNAYYCENEHKIELIANDGSNHLHGGAIGFDKKVWRAKIKTVDGHEALVMSLISEDGEEGYPGRVCVEVSYRLSDENELIINYRARSSKVTPLSMTQHSYFNLGGESSGDVLNHRVSINSDYYTSGDEIMTLSGKREPIQGQASDLRQAKSISDIVNDLHKQHGDLYWVGDHQEAINKISEVFEPNSGRVMKVSTTLPCLQFYTGRYISDQWVGKTGKAYRDLSGFCLECQKYPDPNGVDGFGANWLKPEEEYKETTIYHFSVRT